MTIVRQGKRKKTKKKPPKICAATKGGALIYKMAPFITGSTIYGAVTDESDVDLVMLLPHDDAESLLRGLQLSSQWEDSAKYGDHSIHLRAEKLNLIVCLQPLTYVAWQRATQEAIKVSKQLERKLTKHESKGLFRRVFKELGVEED